MRIFLGADHAGFELKEKIKVFLRELGHEVADEGAFKFDPADDYPDFMEVVAKQVAADPDSRGIIFGGTGQGEAMCANRFKRVRAAVYYGSPRAESRGDESLDIIKLSREHNNANILSLGARFVGEAAAKQTIKLWLETSFSGEDRHIRRIAKLDYKLKSETRF
ncbi:MAG: RpiB/LacA/LacB family sugar-phosphate isomerase [Candidatus Vogelbacteria bacterium]|nr:RpiB/LacA/LacB family sugar-phosphate isomerase [Candidatus Vogelbacteria bacterium]